MNADVQQLTYERDRLRLLLEVASGIKSGCSVPLISHQKTLGVL